jgi:hypothetical protein
MENFSIRMIDTIEGKSPYSHHDVIKSFADNCKDIMRAGLQMALAIKNGTEDDWRAEVVMPFISREKITDELWNKTHRMITEGVHMNAQNFFEKAGDLTPFMRISILGCSLKVDTHYIHYTDGDKWGTKTYLKLTKGTTHQCNKEGNMACFNCRKKTGEKMLKCGGCKTEYYCSTECQKESWEGEDGHKVFCKKIAEERTKMKNEKK